MVRRILLACSLLIALVLAGCPAPATTQPAEATTQPAAPAK